jgi:hypothetical protein
MHVRGDAKVSRVAAAVPAERDRPAGTIGYRTVLAVLWFALLFTLEIGVKNGELNHVFYLLEGLRRSHTQFLINDWYTWSTTPYHAAWAWLVAFLSRSGLLEYGLAVGTIITGLSMAVAVYVAMDARYERPLLPWALTLLLFGGLFTRGLGDLQLVPTSLEPFGMAGAGLLVGMAFLAFERPVPAGIAWGFAGFIHAHFALLLAGVIAFALLVPWPGRRWKDIVLLGIPFAILAAPSLLSVATAGTEGGGREAFAILGRVAPQHYYPWRGDWRPFVVFGGSMLMGAGGLLLRPGRRTPDLATAVCAMSSMVLILLALAALGPFWMINRAIPWRLSSVVMLAAIAAGSAAIAAPQLWRPDRRARIIGLSALALGLTACVVGGTKRFYAVALAVMGLAAVLLWLARRPIHQAVLAGSLRVLPFGLVTVGMLPAVYAELGRSHIDIRTSDPSRAGVYRWIRTDSPVGSVFIIPPSWTDFRLNARRALIADWWAPPMFPHEVIEWDRRMGDLAGIPHPRTLAQVESGYAAMGCQQFESLAERYGADHVVLPSNRPLPCGSEAYRDSSFAVFRLARAGAGPPHAGNR